ncbi:MAG TPA: hypothetical protein VHN79_07270, partial [Lacunisphaera sp.]|nr:hypothetical protein [Lacunisphaera sp.]
MAAEAPAFPVLRLVTRLALTLAAVLLAVWLWSRICRFPSVPWNDMRLAPSVALAQGWPVYPTASTGTISTWMYGPLPVLYLWPASWAPTAAGALLVAAGLNAALTLVPLGLVCLLWPARDARLDSRAARLAAFLACLAVWPELHYSVIFSDNLAIACGLLGMLLLVRARTASLLWLAALAGTAAMGCKQICLGIPVAQVLWLGLTAGRGAARRHLLRCLGCGLALAGGLIALFGWDGLWFTLVQIPTGLGPAPDIAARLRAVAPALAVHVALPMLVMLAARRAFSGPQLLPAVTWLCTLPLGLAGLLSLGGWSNSIHSFVLWLPPVLVAFLTATPARNFRAAAPLAAALMSAALATGRLLHEPALALRPQVDDYRLAAQMAARHPGAVWFPMHPLVTLYSDRRYYHDEDGLYV